MAQNSKTIKKYAARVETCFDDFVEEAVVSKQKSHDVAEDGKTDDSSQTEGSSGWAAIDVVGRHVKQLVNAINRLEQLGVERSVLPLPKIVVVGDQSAGKSSLIEAISEIKVPRSTGTCTRCPLQINLNASEDASEQWSCKVTLQKKYSYLGDSSPDPWLEQALPYDTVFQTVSRKDDLEQVIHWAQIAILNPSKSAAYYAAFNQHQISDHIQVKFSPNVVRLDISGPGLPNLSFYDLPGVISQAENTNDRHLVKLVKNLVREYIKADNVLVLLACSMEGDVANSAASRIVRDMDATSRCVGVLTKPDRLPGDEEFEIWKKILDNKIFELGHSYYVTKQPSQSILGKVSHVQARQQEADFFQQTSPWNTLLAQFKDRFGTVNLQNALSAKLTQQIIVSMPGIKKQIEQKLLVLEEELANFQDPPHENALMVVTELLVKFTSQVAQEFDLENPNTAVKRQMELVLKKLCTTLNDAKPSLYEKERFDTVATPSSSRTAPSPQVTPKKAKVNGRKRQTTAEKLADNAICLDSDEEAHHVKKARKNDNGLVNEAGNSSLRTRYSSVSTRYSVASIRTVIESFSSSYVPNEINSRAWERTCLTSIDTWDPAVLTYITEVKKQINDRMHHHLRESLSAWSSTSLFRDCSIIVGQFVEAVIDELSRYGSYWLRSEKLKPMTMNPVLKANYCSEMKGLEHQRLSSRAHDYFDEIQESTGKEISEHERAKRIEKDTTEGQNLSKLLGQDNFADEIVVLAKARAYYDVAVLESCRSTLYESLKTGLGLLEANASQHCIELLAEDPQREIRKGQLKMETEVLLKAQEQLKALEVEFSV